MPMHISQNLQMKVMFKLRFLISKLMDCYRLVSIGTAAKTHQVCFEVCEQETSCLKLSEGLDLTISIMFMLYPMINYVWFCHALVLVIWVH